MLINVPIVNQRTELGNDKRPPEDGNMDCVPCSLSAMARGLDPSLKTTGDGLHDAVYGQGYIGMQSPAAYLHYLAGLGFSMVEIQGSGTTLINLAIQALRQGHPVLLSIPSDWNNEPPHSPYAHMVAACDTDGSSVTAMNPWTAAYEKQTLEEWAERFDHCSYNGIWVMTKVGGKGMWTKVDAAIPTAQDQHGTKLVYGMADYVLANPTTANAIQGIPVIDYIGDDAATSLEDGSLLWYNKTRNTTEHIGGEDGQLLVRWHAVINALRHATPTIPADYIKDKAAVDALATALAK